MSITSTAQITITSVNDGAKGDKGDSARTYIALNTGEDLNTKIAKDKVYVTSSTAVCASLKNTPSGFISGECRMEVEQLGSDGYLIQRLFCKAGNESKTFTRTYSSGTFGSWVQLGVKGDKGDTGIHATTVEIGLSSIQIPVTVAGLVKAAQTVDVSFGGFYGSSRLSCTATVSNLPSGITSVVTDATVSANGTIRLTIAKDATLGGNLAGLISIALACNTKSFSRTISWVKSVDVLSLQEEISAQADDISSINTSITSMTTELAKKALASDLTTLEGDVEDNASAISGLATRVTSAEGTITAHGTSITQNANAIALKASQSALDTLSGTVSSHGTSITQQASSIEALATRVTNTETVNTSQGTAITQNANAIALKADKTELDTVKGTVTSQGTQISQNATAITTKVTQTQVDNSIATAKSANYGYRYATDITIYGDSDKFYPVVIKAGNQNVKREIFVFRGYSEQAPSDWYTSTHRGGLTLKIKCNFGGWGGANYSWEIIDLEEMYSMMFSGAVNVMSNMAFAVFLRGGGTTGAVYHLFSDQSLTTSIYNVASPQICLNGDSLGVTGQYSWNAPAYRGMKNSASGSNALLDAYAEEIRIRRITKLSQANDTRLTNAQTSITQNANGITALATRMTNAEGSITNHQASITQNADAIALRVQGFDANGNALSNAKLEVGSKDDSGYIHLDADKVIVDGTVKAAKIDVGDLMAKDLAVGNRIRSVNYSEDSAGFPITGFKGGADGIWKAVSAKFRDVYMTGSIDNPEFKTSKSGATVNIPQCVEVQNRATSSKLSQILEPYVGGYYYEGTPSLTSVGTTTNNGVTYNLYAISGTIDGQTLTRVGVGVPNRVVSKSSGAAMTIENGILYINDFCDPSVNPPPGGTNIYYCSGFMSPVTANRMVECSTLTANGTPLSGSLLADPSAFIARFSSVLKNVKLYFTGTVVISAYHYGSDSTVTITSTSSSKCYMIVSDSGIAFFSSSDEALGQVIASSPSDATYQKAYSSLQIIQALVIDSSIPGIEVRNIQSIGTGNQIGTSSVPFTHIWGTTIHGTEVWGAVAN